MRLGLSIAGFATAAAGAACNKLVIWVNDGVMPVMGNGLGGWTIVTNERRGLIWATADPARHRLLWLCDRFRIGNETLSVGDMLLMAAIVLATGAVLSVVVAALSRARARRRGGQTVGLVIDSGPDASAYASVCDASSHCSTPASKGEIIHGSEVPQACGEGGPQQAHREAQGDQGPAQAEGGGVATVAFDGLYSGAAGQPAAPQS